jgi:antitoxin MazE
LALRIPKSFADEVGLETDAAVEVTLVNGKLVVTLVTEPKPTLKQLVARISDDNLHKEVDTGSAVGNEVW